MAILDAFFSLGSKINKVGGRGETQETAEGIVSEKFPELKIDTENSEITKLTDKWQRKWDDSEVKKQMDESGQENEDYWKGKQFNQPKVDKSRPLMDNVIFEALETYLPQVTRRNPDPMVMLSRREQQTKENLAYASELQKELGEVADEIVLRLKLKKTARHWAIYTVGALIPSWDMDRDIPTVKVIRAKKLILDPDATVDEEVGYTGEYFGEHRKMPAGKLLATLEELGGEADGVKALRDKVKADDEDKAQLGTEIGFIQWWTTEYLCWTMGDKVLLKKKYLHWNYDQTSSEEAPYNEDGTPQLDEEGKPKMIENTTPGFNHFTNRRLPIILLSVFNLGKQPVDETSLIGQNLSSQDLVNKRLKQIDKNADSMNGGMVVSLERAGMTMQQATRVTEALRKGGTVAIPAGAVSEAIARMSAPALPGDVFLQLQDTRARMRDIFGTAGSSPAGLSSEKTVRGKLQNRMLDTDRIGGGFSEYLEQIADVVYNWFVQLLYVYDDRYAGKQHPKVRISVKEGSLLPKDSLTLANQAIELAGQNRMSLLDLYKALDYPNPSEMAANAWLEANAPEELYVDDQRVQKVLQARQAAAGKPPSESINFKDLPPDGQAQMAKKVGIELHPEAIAANAEHGAKMEVAKDVAAEAAKRSIPQPEPIAAGNPQPQ